jgi:hypothetical protein
VHATTAISKTRVLRATLSPAFVQHLGPARKLSVTEARSRIGPRSAPPIADARSTPNLHPGLWHFFERSAGGADHQPTGLETAEPITILVARDETKQSEDRASRSLLSQHCSRRAALSACFASTVTRLPSAQSDSVRMGSSRWLRDPKRAS